MLESKLSSVSQADSSRISHPSQPLHLNKAGKQGSSNGASNMVVTLCPIQTLVSEGTPERKQRVGIDV
jgi:hypothetical protein